MVLQLRHPFLDAPIVYRNGMPFTQIRYSDIECVPPVAGVYVIATSVPYGEVVLDVGESENLHERLRNHDRKDYWLSFSVGEPIIYLYWQEPNLASSKWTRFLREKQIRIQENPLRQER